MLVYLSLSKPGISDIIRIEKNLNSYVLMSYFYFKDFDVSIFPNKIIDISFDKNNKIMKDAGVNFI